MRTRDLIGSCLILTFLLFSIAADAQMIDRSIIEKRVKNKIQLRNFIGNDQPQPSNSYVEAKDESGELQVISRREFEQIVQSTPLVKDRIERIYDLNRDGRLQREEIIDMYRDVVLSVQRRGAFTVSSDLLKDFDQNEDGRISLGEATVLSEKIN